MFKPILVAAAFAMILVQPAFADDAMKSGGAMKSDGAMMMKCDDASMMKMQSGVDAMTAPAMKEQKEMAMKEMAMAKDSMKASKMDDCKMHMDNAMKSMSK